MKVRCIRREPRRRKSALVNRALSSALVNDEPSLNPGIFLGLLEGAESSLGAPQTASTEILNFVEHDVDRSEGMFAVCAKRLILLQSRNRSTIFKQ